ncbi:MAG: sensor histidine kinase, partial [Anaerolineae bacterium]
MPVSPLPRVSVSAPQGGAISATDWVGELAELRASAVGSLAVALMAVGYIWGVGYAVVANASFVWDPLALPGSLFAFGLVLLSVRRTAWLRQAVIAAGFLAVVVVALFLDRSPTALVVLLLAVSCCSLVSSSRVSFLAAATGTLLLVVAAGRDPAVVGGGSPFPFVVGLWALAAAGWLTSRNLYTVLGWALDGYESSRVLSAALQQERGRRNATLKALREANALLKRTTYDLAEAREEAERARQMKAQFAANISHELRTPLHLIVGFSQMMYASPESYQGVRWTADLRADIQELYESAVHLLGLIDDVLDLSQIEAARLPLSKE